jgi:pimeloyl-ACP methyl ester carboxylesterase
VEGPADAVPAVFLHGVGSSGRTWEWLREGVARGRRIVRIDLRGHGRSDHAQGTYELTRYGADVVAVLRELVPGQAVLVGHSLGGVVAWWLAQHHPELVGAALLEDPPLLAGETADAEAGRFRDVFHVVKATILAGREHGASDEEMMERIGALRWGLPGTPPFREIFTDDALAALAFGYRRLDIGVIDGAIDGSTLAATDTRSPVAPPVVVVAGDETAGAAFSTDDEARLLQSQPSVRVHRVAGAGHRIHEARSHREAFTAHLGRFLETYGN